MSSAQQTPPPCPGPCEHTPTEHLAFDAGFLAALGGRPRAAPQRSRVVRDAWDWGYDYGLRRGSTKEAPHAQ